MLFTSIDTVTIANTFLFLQFQLPHSYQVLPGYTAFIFHSYQLVLYSLFLINYFVYACSTRLDHYKLVYTMCPVYVPTEYTQYYKYSGWFICVTISDDTSL